MKSKLNFLINVSLKKKIKSKWFLFANIIVGLLIIGIINIDSIITLFGGDFNEKTKIYVIDETNIVVDSIEQSLKYYSEFLNDEDDTYEIVKTDKSEKEIIDLINEEENKSLLLEIYFNDKNNMEAKLVSLSTIDAYDYQLISNSLNISSNNYLLSSFGLSDDQLRQISEGITINREILDENIKDEDENTEMIMTTVFPVIILPFFMLTIFLIQFIGTEINDEKSTKSMEIIISSVPPKTHFAAKIIANNLFIILQLILLVIFGAIGFGVRKLIGGNTILNGLGEEVGNIINTITRGALGDKFIIIIIFAVILMVLTFIAYSVIAGILASMTTNPEDYQQIQVPIIITLLLGYYLSIMAGMFKGSMFIQILSYFPLISAVLSPSLLVLGQIGLVDVIISIVIIIITNYALIKYGIRVYKVGILNYSTTGLWKKIFKSLRNKEVS